MMLDRDTAVGTPHAGLPTIAAALPGATPSCRSDTRSGSSVLRRWSGHAAAEAVASTADVVRCARTSATGDAIAVREYEFVVVEHPPVL